MPDIPVPTRSRFRFVRTAGQDGRVDEVGLPGGVRRIDHELRWSGMSNGGEMPGLTDSLARGCGLRGSQTRSISRNTSSSVISDRVGHDGRPFS